MTGYTGPERRRDPETRRRLNEMSREDMLQLLMTDALTGALSPRAFQDAEAHRAADCYVLFDLDSLKWLNDRFGHAAGDALLQEFVTAAYQQGFVLFRLGGDEFALRVEQENWRQADLWNQMTAIQSRFRETVITWRDEQGERHGVVGASCSFGYDSSLTAADAHLRRMKHARALSGARSVRGSKPRNLRLLDAHDLMSEAA